MRLDSAIVYLRLFPVGCVHRWASTNPETGEHRFSTRSPLFSHRFPFPLESARFAKAQSPKNSSYQIILRTPKPGERKLQLGHVRELSSSSLLLSIQNASFWTRSHRGPEVGRYGRFCRDQVEISAVQINDHRVPQVSLGTQACTRCNGDIALQRVAFWVHVPRTIFPHNDDLLLCLKLG